MSSRLLPTIASILIVVQMMTLGAAWTTTSVPNIAREAPSLRYVEWPSVIMADPDLLKEDYPPFCDYGQMHVETTYSLDPAVRGAPLANAYRIW